MPEFRFPVKQRLRKKDDFKQIFQYRCCLYGTYLKLYVKPNKLSYPRLGILISKQVVRYAINRNRIRRHIREAFRLRQHQIQAYDILVLLQKNITNQSIREIDSCLEKLFSQFIGSFKAC